VRYDAVLGRVRALWDYALKGAKTQRGRRERGEYNRPRRGGGSNADRHRRRKIGGPGHGVSSGYLARSLPGDGAGAGETEDGGGASTVAGVGEMGVFADENGGRRGVVVLGDGVGGGMKRLPDGDEDKMRKRVKRERMRELGGESGSEYSDGSGSD